jgi:hypothetical protein
MLLNFINPITCPHGMAITTSKNDNTLSSSWRKNNFMVWPDLRTRHTFAQHYLFLMKMVASWPSFSYNNVIY